MIPDAMLANGMFAAMILLTLGITAWAARRVNSRTGFYTAGGTIGGVQNGLAISGDFMSAATFLGITGLVFVGGYDAIIYIISPLAGLALILALFAEPLRRLGRYTLADLLAARFPGPGVRSYAASSTLLISLFYLVAQVVGAGALIEAVFGIAYSTAVLIVGTLMAIYVAFGGMLATTWVQIVKAVMLSLGVALLALLVLAESGFSFETLYSAAAANHPDGRAIFAPGGIVPETFDALSLATGLVFGMAGLPHLLIRFYTVPDLRQARRSVIYAMLVVGFVFVLIFYVIGYGALAYVPGDAAAYADGALVGGGNMAAIHLSRVVGGPLFLGLIAAVAFATILAVVAGLTMAAAGAVSHDLYASLLRKGEATEREELLVSRLAALMTGAAAILLGLVFKGQNIAYLVALTFTVAATANFPVLLLSLNWRGLTARAVTLGGGLSLLMAVAVVAFGPVVWRDVLGHPAALIDIAHPALITMPLAFLVIMAIARLDRRSHAVEADAFDRMRQALAGQTESTS